MHAECAESKQCAPHKHHYEECAERVTKQMEENDGKAKEDCVEECMLLVLYLLVVEETNRSQSSTSHIAQRPAPHQNYSDSLSDRLRGYLPYSIIRQCEPLACGIYSALYKVPTWWCKDVELSRRVVNRRSILAPHWLKQSNYI